MNNISDLMEMDLVNETIKRLSATKKEELLKSAVASRLQGAVKNDDSREKGLRKLFHKAQSLMSGDKSHEWTNYIMDTYGIDARNGKSVRGPRRKVFHFVGHLHSKEDN